MTITLLLSLYLGTNLNSSLQYCNEAQYTVAYIQATNKIEKEIAKEEMKIESWICEKIQKKYKNLFVNY